MADLDIRVDIVRSLSSVPPAVWDACANPQDTGPRPKDPFTTHRFLLALEQSGSVGDGTGWDPFYLIAYAGETAIGVAPLYLKHHSQGEYIFDHNFAHAYERAGGQYYPKLQVAVPFTPATGRRFLVRPEHKDIATSALVQAAQRLALNNGLSSLHITFCTDDEYSQASDLGLMQRVSQQFHWRNDTYASFDAFLATLSSRKRKNIRKEREVANQFGGEFEILSGDDIQPIHWDYFWQFYQDTGARKWGSPYLTRSFFDIAHETLRDDILLVMARKDDKYIAGALNFIGSDTLFGRYWGCLEHYPCLHFEACYYRAMDFAISNGLDRIEAGAQGEHKLSRGYMPSETYSLHWFADEGFAQAVESYLKAERDAVKDDIEILTAYGPFKTATIEEQD